MLMNNKLHIDRRKAEVNMNCFLFNNTSCSPKQKSTTVLLYKKNILIENPVIYAKFRLTLLHKPCDITAFVTDYATLLEATSPPMRH